MKKFLMTFFICLVLVFVFMFFGGSVLLDVSRHFGAFLVFVSLVLAVLASILEALWEKLGALEAQVRTMEEQVRSSETMKDSKDSRDKENNQ